jgi:hypothetical protein
MGVDWRDFSGVASMDAGRERSYLTRGSPVFVLPISIKTSLVAIATSTAVDYFR